MMQEVSSFQLKKVVVMAFGFWNIVFFSMGSFSYMIEQVGPIIISKKIMCMGENKDKNFHPRTNGIKTMSIMGIWMEITY